MNITFELPSTRRASSVDVCATDAGSAQADIRLVDAERQRCEVWTRVMGYHRPVSSFNTGKQAEHAERRFFKAPPCTRR